MKLSLLKLYVSLCIVDYATSSFDQIVFQMPMGLYRYFKLFDHPLSEQHKLAWRVHSVASTKVAILSL